MISAQRNEPVEAIFRALAEYAARLHGSSGEADCIAACVMKLGAAVGEGAVCLPLAEIETKDREILLRSAAIAAATSAANELHPAPLRHDGERLYLSRHYQQELEVARDLFRRAQIVQKKTPGAASINGLNERQNEAVLASLRRRVVLVSGGPGSGKTRTAAAMLAEHVRRQPGLRVAVTAPTGKAAARLSDSLRTLCGDSFQPEWQAMTVHRLLGAGGGYRFNETNPLPVDLLLIDEASMLDLELLAAILRALPADARLALFGDRDQLASVEAGAALAELSRAEELSDCIIELNENYRFSSKSQIAALSSAIRQGDQHAAQILLNAARPDDDALLPPELEYLALDTAALRERILRFYRPAFEADSPLQALEALERFRLLCALRRGPAGVENLNRLALATLHSAGFAVRADSVAFQGCPILITANDYELGLFNGDSGVVFGDENGALRAWFRASGAQPDAGAKPATDGLRSFSLNLLPEHEAAFALTVHKSQGSEYDSVAFVAPRQTELPLFSRELIYTAITRARKSAIVYGDLAAILAGIARRTERASGLRARLRETAAAASSARKQKARS